MLTAVDRNSFSARFRPEEEASITAFLEHYQTENGIEFNSFRDFFIHLVKNGATLMSGPETGESILVEDLQPHLKTFADENALPLESTAKEIVLKALTAEPETIEGEKEVIKEVPLEIPENLLVLELDKEQEEALTEINTARNERLEAANHPIETKEDTAKGMLFNKATLNNYGGEFFTGFG